MVSANTASRQCTRCDAAVAADARFCVECGTPVDSAAAPHIQPVQVRRCFTCSGTNPVGAAFCVHCGRSLEQPVAGGYAPPQPAIVGGTSANALVQQVYITHTAHPPIPILVRALWFVFIGLWLGQFWLIIGWLLNLSIIGLPLGLWMLNRTGHVMTLRQMPPNVPTDIAASSMNLAVRGIYFMLIGWWVSLIWLMFGWLAAATVIGLPIAFMMFEHIGTVATLADA